MLCVAEGVTNSVAADLAAAFAGLAELLADAVVAEVDSGVHIVVLFAGGKVFAAGEDDIDTRTTTPHGQRYQPLGLFVITHAVDLLEALDGVILQGISGGKIAENDF